MKRVILIGAGGLATEVAEWIGFERVAGFLVDPEHAHERDWNGLRILGRIDQWREFPESYEFLCAIADPLAKKRITESMLGANWHRFIHPLAYLAKTSSVSEGAIIGPFAVAGNGCVISTHVIMNYHSVAGHGSFIGDFSTLSPHAALMGGAELWEGCFMGTGAKILPRVRVTPWTKISAGAIVRKDFGFDATANYGPGHVLYGDPAKVRS